MCSPCISLITSSPFLLGSVFSGQLTACGAYYKLFGTRQRDAVSRYRKDEQPLLRELLSSLASQLLVGKAGKSKNSDFCCYLCQSISDKKVTPSKRSGFTSFCCWPSVPLSLFWAQEQGPLSISATDFFYQEIRDRSWKFCLRPHPQQGAERGIHSSWALWVVKLCLSHASHEAEENWMHTGRWWQSLRGLDRK